MSALTIDGYPVKPGLRVWDYDLRRAVVVAPRPNGHPAEGTWWQMRTPEGEPSSDMDGLRMWVRHPGTGERA